MGEDLPAVRIKPTFINDAYKCNTLLNRHLPNGQNQTSTFPCTIEQALSLYPWVQTKCVDLMAQLVDGRHFSQLTGLIRLLSQSKSPVPAESCSTPRSDNDNYFLVECQTLKNRERDYQAKVGILGASGKRLLENQKLHNWMKDLIHQNKRLKMNLPPASVTYYFLREQSHKIFVSIRTKTNHLAHSRPSVTWMYQGVSCNKLAHMLNGNRNRCYNIGI